MWYTVNMQNINVSDKVLFHVTQTGELAVTYYTNDSRIYSSYRYPSNVEGAKECLKRISREKKTSLLFTELFIQKTAVNFKKEIKSFAKKNTMCYDDKVF